MGLWRNSQIKYLKINGKVCLFALLRGHYLQAAGGDIGGGDETEALDVDDDTLLTGCAGYATYHARELTGDDTHDVAALVVDLAGVDHTNILTDGARGDDEALHALVRDHQRGIVAAGGLMEVVVVVGNEGTDCRFLDGQVEGTRFGMGKK